MNCAAVRDTIIYWLKNQLLTSGQNGFVVGVSGGVDSALVSTLCAMTGEPTVLISMPIFQAPDQLKRALDHIDWLEKLYPNKIKSFYIDLTSAFETMQSVFPNNVGIDDLAMANTRSRLRMVTLYAFANHHKSLVVGTGNKVEDFGVFYYTKGGDGQVDLSPIGDLSKSQIWELAKFIEVNDSIVTAKPNDGLWKDNRGDEDAIGATYPELEWAMAEVDTKGFKWLGGTANIKYDNSYTPKQNQIMTIYLKRHYQGSHKIKPIPVCNIPKIIL